MKKKLLWKTTAIFMPFLLFITGCADVGPRQLPIYQYNYNNSLNYGLNQELLLNIVRLAYDDTPYFLTVSSISAQMELTAAASGNVTIAKNTPNYSGSPDTYSAGPSVSYTQRPTISYTPMQGDEFARRMLQPIDVDDLNNFSTWSIQKTLRIVVQNIGPLYNAENSTRPTSHLAPVYYQQFIDLALLVRILQEQFKVDIFVIDAPNKAQIEKAPNSILGRQGLEFEADFNDMQDPNTRKVFALLGVPTTYNKIIFTESDHKGVSGNVVNIQTRSFLGILYYLSKGVEIPPEHLKAGLIDITRNADGTVFDWQKVTNGMIKIHYSKSMPKNAAIAIYYHNYWFYVAEDDHDSKKTFAMLSQLYALLSKDVSGNRPVLTLPV